MARRKQLSPAADPPNVIGSTGNTLDAAQAAPLPVKAGFMSGTDGTTNMTWARYQVPVMASFGTLSLAGVTSGTYSRESALASAVAQDLQTSNPVLSTILDNLELYAVGTGLTLSAKPDLAKYGVSKEEIRALAHEIETRWNTYASNPREVDYTGRKDLHALASAAFRSYLLNGEAVATLDFAPFPGSRSFTKVALLDVTQLDRTKTLQSEGLRSVNGVAFSEAGRLVGYWLRKVPMGSTVANPLPVLVSACTSWGRPKVIHLFQQREARQVRGMTPLAPSLTPAHARETLGEFTLASAYLQTQFSLTVESEFPAQVALQGLAVNHAEGGMSEWLDYRKDWYSAAKITPKPGVINHLAPGDKLRFNRSETPNTTYEAFDKSLTRRAARAAGDSYEAVSGDFSQTSFSASRWANETPHRMALKRRAEIVVPFYAAVFRCWLEEEIEMGRIKLPRKAPAFWQDPEAYLAAKWLGAPRSEPDRNKLAMAQEHELSNGLLSLTDALAERGIDFETHLETLENEKAQLEALGLKHPFWSERVKASQQISTMESNP